MASARQVHGQDVDGRGRDELEEQALRQEAEALQYFRSTRDKLGNRMRPVLPPRRPTSPPPPPRPRPTSRRTLDNSQGRPHALQSTHNNNNNKMDNKSNNVADNKAKTTWLMPPPEAVRSSSATLGQTSSSTGASAGDLITLSHSSSAPKFLAMKASLSKLYSMSSMDSSNNNNNNNNNNSMSKMAYSRSHTSPIPAILEANTSMDGFRARQSGFNETVVRPTLSIHWMSQQQGLGQPQLPPREGPHQQLAPQVLQLPHQMLPLQQTQLHAQHQQQMRGSGPFRPEEPSSRPTTSTDEVMTMTTLYDDDGMVKSMSWTDTNPPSPVSSSDSKLAIRGSVSDFSLMSKQSVEGQAKDDKDDCNEKSLIDLGPYNLKGAELKLTRVGVLEAFDPLVMQDEEDWPDNFVSNDNINKGEQDNKEIRKRKKGTDDNCYFEYDPFEYMAGHEESVCEQGTVETTTEASTPTPSTTATNEECFDSDLRESIRKEQDVAVDSEIEAFAKMASDIRAKFKCDDSKTNVGLVKSARIQAVYPEDASLKIVVQAPDVFGLNDGGHKEEGVCSVSFTCSVSTSVEHLVYKALSDFESLWNKRSYRDDQLIFRVPGAFEYLDPSCKLQDYQYVHQCYKFDQDVQLTLEPILKAHKMYLRTNEDDVNDSVVSVADISPKDAIKTLTHENLLILLDTLEKECDRFKQNVEYLVTSEETNVFHTLRPKQLLQGVKAVCAFLGSIELLEVREVCSELVQLCLALDGHKGNDAPDGLRKRSDIIEEVGDHLGHISLSSSAPISDYSSAIKTVVNKVKLEVQRSVLVYSKTFRVNFSVQMDSKSKTGGKKKLKESIEVQDRLGLRVCSLHRLDPDWNYDDYQLSCQVYHGSRPVAEAVYSTYCSRNGKGFYPCVMFNQWLQSSNLRINGLPREARLVLSLRGRKSESGRESRDTMSTKLYELGWTALQLFDHENVLAQGTYALSIWPLVVEKQLGPAPDSGSHPRAQSCPVISVELPCIEGNTMIRFPDKIPIMMVDKNKRDINELDYYTREQLLESCNQDLMTFTDLPSYQRDALFNKRFYLVNEPSALPKVLLAAKSWQYDQLPQLYGLMHSWRGLEPMHLLQLFLPCFPDGQVRECAVDWLSSVHNDELVQYLPQLLEAYKHDTFAVSPLAKLLISKSLEAPRIAHSLYWLLTQSLPGLTPQNTMGEDEGVSGSEDYAQIYQLARYRRRLQMLMRALYTVVGSAVRSSFLRQQQLIKLLHNSAVEVQNSRGSDLITSRNLTLRRTLSLVSSFLMSDPTTLPLSPSLVAFNLEMESCGYFNSNTVPLKLFFVTEDSKANEERKSVDNVGLGSLQLPMIFKVGDDLRQDMLTLQMIRVMDHIWLKENLDLKIVTFECVPTGRKQGVIEMVRDAKTLREIQVMSSGSVTGSFRETPLYQWLQKHNPSPLEFARAVDNFTRSCAGYSIVTYILGVCDRHNDNIMVKQSGHLLHIDFGKFLGDAQLFGNIRRDRAPFVLTPDMAYVINGGIKPSHSFHAFVDLCCTGFNLVRKHGNMLLNLFALMASSGIPGVSLNAVRYVQRALLPDLSEAEAATTFARMIEESLASWFTQFNFFIHNLGQMRFANEAEEPGELLSFVPKRYTMKSDGRIEAVTVYAIQKRYEPEKHYVFILRIEREQLKDAVFLFRSYKEFCELDSKISKAFPIMQSHSLRSTTFSVGRQEIRNVAERRKHAIARFLNALFTSTDESVAHSDLVYTFFHPLLRDQEEASVHISKLKSSDTNNNDTNTEMGVMGSNSGQLKLAVYYSKETLHVLVCHARNLSNDEEPNSYVKLYLYPDPNKTTKRKTKVVRKNAHPSFMEMLEYRMPLDRVRCRSLQVSVWNYDRFQENVFLGAVIIGLDDIQLDDQTPKWHTLTSLNQR